MAEPREKHRAASEQKSGLLASAQLRTQALAVIINVFPSRAYCMASESDIYSEVDPPRYLYHVGIPLAGLAFLGTAGVRDDAAPLFAALSAGALCMMVGLVWPLRRRKMLWVILTAIAALHGAAVTFSRFPHEVRYGIAFAPLVALDVVIFWKLTVWLLKVFD